MPRDSKWEYWLQQGDEFSPIEFGEDGECFSVVYGLCIVSSLDAMKERAKKIWAVDDMYEPKDAKLVYERGSHEDHP
jgi:hypothetical protein